METGFLCVALAVLGLPVDQSGLKLRALLASAFSRKLGLKRCASTPPPQLMMLMQECETTFWELGLKSKLNWTFYLSHGPAYPHKDLHTSLPCSRVPGLCFSNSHQNTDFTALSHCFSHYVLSHFHPLLWHFETTLASLSADGGPPQPKQPSQLPLSTEQSYM